MDDEQEGRATRPRSAQHEIQRYQFRYSKSIDHFGSRAGPFGSRMLRRCHRSAPARFFAGAALEIDQCCGSRRLFQCKFRGSYRPLRAEHFCERTSEVGAAPVTIRASLVLESRMHGYATPRSTRSYFALCPATEAIFGRRSCSHATDFSTTFSRTSVTWIFV